MGFRWLAGVRDVQVEEWDSVLYRSRRPSPFLSRRFLVPWAGSFATGLAVRVARWERGGKAEGFLFLSERGEGAGWELLGGEEIADSLDALVTAGLEDEFWAGFLPFAGEILGEGPLSLPNVPEGSPSLSLLPRLCEARGVACLIEETDRSPYLPLPGSFESYLEALGKKERHELRRKIRRAGEAIPGMALRVTRTPEELGRDLASFSDLHRRSRPDKSRFMDNRMEAFFREVAEGFLSDGRLRLAFLSGENGDVAAAFQIRTDGALLLYNSGYDPAYRGANPGLVLLARCIEGAISEGLGEYDFLRGTERYKYDLGARDRSVFRVTMRLP